MKAEKTRRDLLALAIAAVTGMALIAGQAPAPTSVFTAGQAAAGRAAYQANCASCHLPDLAGTNEAPPLAGSNFMNTWRSRTTKDLFDYMQGAMPPTGPSLSADQYLAIAAFVLQANGAPAGTQAFTPVVAVPIGTVATGQPQLAQGPATPRQAQGRPEPSRGTTASGQVAQAPAAGGGRGQAASADGDQAPGGGRGQAPPPGERSHGHRRGEELRAGHRRHAAQS